ncbi:MAG: carbohydrate-binding protein [Opitutaceae bacterium]|nr:carbohydrate-binding protein [Cytophagales bacterium]
MLLSCSILSPVLAVTNQFRGVNWADSRDNFQSGNIYLSGLNATDTYSSASVVADRILGQFVTKMGTNSVRMPINEPTVANYWNTYTGAIDMALTKGKVILCFWSKVHGVKPDNMTAYWAMWQKVTAKYGSNSNCYFEVYNEPSSYNKTDLNNLYYEWLTRYPSVPDGRVILDGTGLAMNVPDVGSDTRLKDCLLAVHDYSMWGFFTSEQQWKDHLKGEVGAYADRTVMTEFGSPMSPGTRDGINYGVQDYNSPPGTYFVAYLRGMTSQLREWKMGSFYWIGLRDNDWYSLTTKTGTGANINLTVTNQSGLDRIKYSWGDLPATAPVVTLTAPLNNASFTAPASLTLSAIASDADGIVSKVEFYNGTTKLGEDITIPYTFNWTNVVSGNYSITAKATDNTGLSTLSNIILVKVNVPQSPFNASAFVIPGIIQAEQYDWGGQGVAYYEANTNGNQGLANYRNDEVDIEATQDANGAYNISYALTGEWLEYTVNVTSGGIYSLDLRLASDGAGKKMHLEIGGVNISGAITVPNSAGWQTWETVTVNNINLTSGQKVIRIVFDSDYINFNWLEFKKMIPTGLKEENLASPAIFPNPFSTDGLHINKTGSFLYKITDLSGSQVVSGSAENQETIGYGLNPGVYLLFVEDVKGTFCQKIIKY